MSVASDALHVAVFASLPPGDPQTPPLPRVGIGVLPGPSNDPRRSHETTSPPLRNFAPEIHRQHLSGDLRTVHLRGTSLRRPTDSTSPETHGQHLSGDPRTAPLLSTFLDLFSGDPLTLPLPAFVVGPLPPGEVNPPPLHLHMHPAPGEDSTSPLHLFWHYLWRGTDTTSPCVQSRGFPMPGRRGSHTNTTSPPITWSGAQDSSPPAICWWFPPSV